MNRSPLFNYAWFNDFTNTLEELSTLSMVENWDYKNTPNGRYPILFNYIHHTFAKLQDEDKIIIEDNFSVFNTGLVTPGQEEIFAYFEKNKNPNTSIKWYFKGWRKNSDRSLMKFSKLPKIADYFEDPSELIYDIRNELRINIDHIIQDNKSRFPSSIQEMGDHQLSILLDGTIKDAKKRVKRNYKTAIPQFYNNKLQLLLPVCLTSKSIADLALVVEKENGVYRATTCLTLDMAINNARLIAKPDDEWLTP